VLADEPREHVAHAGDGGVEIERLAGGGLVAAEREELTRQAGGALRRALDLAEVVVRGIAGPIAREHELAAAGEHGQHVVGVGRASPPRPVTLSSFWFQSVRRPARSTT